MSGVTERLRDRAARARRRVELRGAPWGDVAIDPDEADALADLVDAAEPFRWQRRYQADPGEMVTVTVTGAQMHALYDALARLSGDREGAADGR